MEKRCIKCRGLKDEKDFCEFTAITLIGREKRRRNTCYDCNYRNHVFKTFTWKTATKQQILEQLEKRFNKYVIKQEGCWDWNGFVRPDGYTRMRVGFHTAKKSIGGHVVSWMIYKKILKFDGFMKEGFYILHKCDNKRCTNPKHLYLGNCSDNMIDMVTRKRHSNIKLTVQQVRNVKKMLIERVKIVDIARKYRVNRATISDIKKNKTWKYVKL